MYYATAKEMERLDKLAVANGLEIRQMMELAGWHMVSLFYKLQISQKEKVLVIVGKGNKGGDGLSAARHLANHGWKVKVLLLDKEITSDSQHHLDLLEKMRFSIELYSPGKNYTKGSDVIVDSLIGYHLDGPPRGVFKEVIEAINTSQRGVVSYDLPSGVDATTGECFDPCVQAHATLSLAMPKKVFDTPEGKAKSGQIFVADIGIPAFLYDEIAQGSRPPFENSLIAL